MESAFAIIAEPNRRAMLMLLATSERSVGELERQLRMPQPSVSKHLRVLREAGFVESRGIRGSYNAGPCRRRRDPKGREPVDAHSGP